MWVTRRLRVNIQWDILILITKMNYTYLAIHKITVDNRRKTLSLMLFITTEITKCDKKYKII